VELRPDRLGCGGDLRRVGDVELERLDAVLSQCVGVCRGTDTAVNPPARSRQPYGRREPDAGRGTGDDDRTSRAF
jgi:hypothetical protein